MLPRLYDVDQGEICIDGINVKAYDLQKLRGSIGFVPQKALLFSGSIEENLRYGKEDATKEELEVAASSACATEFINKLEDSYQYHVTQGATNLSGGQKQRVSIARALVRKPSILVLDDSTSAVDAKSESNIQLALRREYKGTTTLLIASKISSIIDADKILVLDNGELVDDGTHEELLEQCEVYQEIYLSQGGNLYKKVGKNMRNFQGQFANKGGRNASKMGKAKNTKGTVMRVWNYMGYQKAALTFVIFLVFVTTLLGLLGPYLMGVIIDQYIVPKDLSGTARMCLILIAIYGVTVLLTWLQTFVMVNVALKRYKNKTRYF